MERTFGEEERADMPHRLVESNIEQCWQPWGTISNGVGFFRGVCESEGRRSRGACGTW